MWLVRVEEGDAFARRLVAWGHRLLNRDELAEVRRLQAASDRLVMIASRGLQRLAVARYLGQDPRQIAIRRTCMHCGDPSHGRPRVQGGGGLDFSVSHQGQWVGLAAVGAGRVGLDLEYRRPLADLDDLAHGVLAVGEAREYAALGGADRDRYFYRAWARKEAVLKLSGQGMARDPALVDVRGAVAEVGGSTYSPPSAWLRDPVELMDLPAPPDYCAALASTVGIRRVTYGRLVVQ